MTIPAYARALPSSVLRSAVTAGSSASLIACTVATCMTVGNTSLEDWPRFTSSLGWIGFERAITPPASWMARLAMTSLAFMFDCVPEPVWNTTSGNSSSHRPAMTSSAARTMSSALSGGSWPSARLASAAHFLTMPNARMTGRPQRKRPRPIGKFSSERWVCAPQRWSAGTSTSPSASSSVRVFMMDRIRRRSGFGGGLGGQRVGARVEVGEVVAPRPGGGVAALAAEPHREAPPADQRAARLDDLGNQRVLRAPPALQPRAHALVVVHDGHRGALGEEPQRQVQCRELGEHVAQAVERCRDRARRRERRQPGAREDLVHGEAQRLDDLGLAVRRALHQDDADAAEVVAVDERVAPGLERGPLAAQHGLGLLAAADSLVARPGDPLHRRRAGRPGVVDPSDALGLGDDVDLGAGLSHAARSPP